MKRNPILDYLKEAVDAAEAVVRAPRSGPTMAWVDYASILQFDGPGQRTIEAPDTFVCMYVTTALGVTPGSPRCRWYTTWRLRRLLRRNGVLVLRDATGRDLLLTPLFLYGDDLAFVQPICVGRGLSASVAVIFASQAAPAGLYQDPKVSPAAALRRKAAFEAIVGWRLLVILRGYVTQEI